MIIFICAVLLQVVYFICIINNSFKRSSDCVLNDDWKGAIKESEIQFSIVLNAFICFLINYIVYLLIK